MRTFFAVVALALTSSVAANATPPLAVATAGTFVEWGGSYWPASVSRSSAGTSNYRVHYIGWGNEWDEVASCARVFRESARGKLLAESQGSYWPALVIGQRNGEVVIHYEGWGPEWDETVSRARLVRIGANMCPTPLPSS